MGWNTEENFISSATVTIELLKEESNFSPIQAPSDLKEKKSLIFEFPESTQHIQQQQMNKHVDQSGIRAVLPHPELLTAPKTLYTVGISKKEMSQQVVSELKRIASEVFESPESCSSTGDVAGHLVAISKYLQNLNYDELKAIKDEVLQAHERSESAHKAIKSLLYDVLSAVGSNPSIMLIKKDIESGELTGRLAVNALEGAFRSIKTPTQEILKELAQLVKSTKNLEWTEKQVYGYSVKDLKNIGMIHMSKLLYRSCISPIRRMTEFPIRIYGHFGSNESRIITEEWIPYLEAEIESSSEGRQENEQQLLVSITSLGKLGHINGLKTLVKVIDGTIPASSLARSVAVYSLKRVAKLNPVLVKPILLSIIDNPADNTVVRIAAVSVLPWTQPSMAQLQKMAVRTWFEPSRQVSSFISSTLKSLSQTEVPELKAVGLKASSLLQIAKPHPFGAQYSQNLNFAEFVNYLKTAISKKISWVHSEEDRIPSKIGVSNNFYNPGFVVRGLSYSIYNEGMDHLLDKVLTNLNKHSASDSVRAQLEKISEELKIKEQKERPSHLFIQSRIAGFETIYTLNKDHVMEALNRVVEGVRRNPELLTESRQFEYARALEVFNIQTAQPTSAGFLRMRQTVMPVVFSAKGFFEGEKPFDARLPIPTKVSAKLMPVLNTKVHSHMGVVCPFTNSFVGAGIDASLHLSTPVQMKVEVDDMDHVSVEIKTPESINKVTMKQRLID